MHKPKMMVHFELEQKSSGIYEMYLYDNVTARGKFDWSEWKEVKSETSAQFFREKLAEIPGDATINLYINSNGGNVKEGVGIYNQLKRHGATVNGYVDGNAYSVAFLILMACDHRVMNLGTSALVHNMWMEVCGNAKALRAYADDLDKLMESNRQIFLEACKDKITEEQLIQMMDEETFLTPDECLRYGFIDEVNKDSEAPEDSDNPDDIDNPDDQNELLQVLRGMGIMSLKEQSEKRREFVKVIQEFQDVVEKEKNQTGYAQAAKFFEQFAK